MGRTANRLIEAECNQIRRLLEDEDKNWTDEEIMEKLHIKRSTFYDRKLRIAAQDREVWIKSRSIPLEKRALDILKSFEDGYRTAKDIRDSPESPEKDRIEAAKMAIKCKVNIFHLMKGGPTPDFNVVTISGQGQGQDKTNNNVKHEKPALESR